MQPDPKTPKARLALVVALVAGLWAVSTAPAALAPETFADIAQKDSPAVVNISAEKIVKGQKYLREFFGPMPFGSPEQFKDFYEKFLGEAPKDLKQRSLGSGFIIDPKGLMITNNHVIEGAEKIKVRMAGGKEYAATVKGRDLKTDLALLQIEGPGPFPYLTLGNSDALRVGDWVLAVGNPFGLGHTVTQGIISATGRVIGAGPYDNFLQTDAAINLGNSGGPLLNLKGEVIGINTAIVATGQGIGFAIPSSLAKSVIPQLQEKGKVTRGMLGVQVQTITPELAKSFGLSEPRGALVGEVTPGSPADKGGIKPGDVIVQFNGTPIKEMHDLPRLVAATAPGTKATLKLLREGKEKVITTTVVEMKEERQAKSAGREAKEGLLGLAVQDLDPSLAQRLGLSGAKGVVVTRVASGSAAAEAGLQPGDLIVEVNGQAVTGANEFQRLLAGLKKGSYARVLIKRQGQSLYVSLEIPPK